MCKQWTFPKIKLVCVNDVVKNHSNIVNSIGVNLSESYVHRKGEVWPKFPKIWPIILLLLFHRNETSRYLHSFWLLERFDSTVTARLFTMNECWCRQNREGGGFSGQDWPNWFRLEQNKVLGLLKVQSTTQLVRNPNPTPPWSWTWGETTQIKNPLTTMDLCCTIRKTNCSAQCPFSYI